MKLQGEVFSKSIQWIFTGISLRNGWLELFFVSPKNMTVFFRSYNRKTQRILLLNLFSMILIDWLFGWLIYWLIYRFIDLYINLLIDWLIDWLNDRLFYYYYSSLHESQQIDWRLCLLWWSLIWPGIENHDRSCVGDSIFSLQKSRNSTCTDKRKPAMHYCLQH